MDYSTYHSSASPETKMEHIPDTDFYATSGWTDGMFMPGPAPFSPVMSDTNQSAYTLPASDVSFPSLGPSISQEMPMMDAYQANSWSSEQPSYNFFAEPAVTETEMFAFPAQGMDVSQPTFNAWYPPTEASAETYFAMDTQGQSFARMIPQIAGFVGNPVTMVPTTGYSSSNLQGGRVRVDSLYTQACPRDVAVSHNHIPSDAHISDVAGPRRMTVPVSLNEPVQAIPVPKSEQDVPYGAPIQQYRSHAPGYPSGLTMPFAGQPEVPVLGSNASVSSVGSVAPSGYEDIPCSPASSTATTRTKTEDTDGRARTDVLYSAKPGRDGSYRCPFVTSEGCQHKATKLKCNYDKYIDSHIKPFRCKHQNCNNNRFSSTACLLRHEREAHGLHGHGNKPFLCEFKDCDRSSSDNGFPRAYNLLDHMKRVHGYRPEKVAKTPPAQHAGRLPGKSQDKVKKRKITGEVPQQKSSAVKKETASPRLAQKLAVDQRKQQMTAQWQTQVNEMQRRSRQFG
ncbi:hypothetical protein D6D06_10154 [Aureobasidium pullulans]|nr:hypothetical protein D6D06_10154 [Aureobasidium pullulans]THY94929.1 hypothetical protein D6C95_05519 [Aureobasidium pullulans]TIA09793.1 hypothetical protein D6C80_08410 [Aureobasidium pullulans]